MPAHKLVPDCRTLERWIGKGMTQREMVDEIERTTGIKVTRSAVAQSIVRCGLGGERTRYEQHIPWHVKEHHLAEYPPRMLRLLGRKQTGKELTEREDRRLELWIDRLRKDRTVVAYDPDSKYGFAYVPRRTGDPRTIPIRRGITKLPD